MAKKSARDDSRKSGKIEEPLKIKCLSANQGRFTIYIFPFKASELWKIVSINRRAQDKDEGYQRALSSARVNAVAKHIVEKKPIPTSVLIGFDKGTFDKRTSTLSIPRGKDVGWVIDGQHRIAGAHRASLEGVDFEFCVCAFLGLTPEDQIDQFITINREAKGVPTSLVYDLLKHLPTKTKPSDVANERAAEIATELRKDPESVFNGRIVVTSSPKSGQLSLTNFVRKISPLVHPERGLLNVFTFEEQKQIIENYFVALKAVFPSQWKKADNIFFKTVGFGALLNVLDTIFKEVMQRSSGSFEVKSIIEILQGVSHFDFAQWEELGSGNKAEMEAAEDFRVDLNRGLANLKNSSRIKL